jgi:hypothetical protein
VLKKTSKLFNIRQLQKEINFRYINVSSRINAKKNIKFISRYQQKELKCQPIFIIGPPRCGSTLLYQVMTHRFKFAYFQNQMILRKYSIPLFTSKHVDPFNFYYSDFKSVHGRTTQPNDPHEGYLFWRRFYPRKTHDYIGEHKLLVKQVNEISNTIKFMIDYFGLPFLSKNMEIGLRLRSILKIFPNAIFIVVKRDPRSTASSLLNARLKDYNSKDVWWSIRPKEYEGLIKLPYYEQIAYQIANIYNTIHQDIENSNNLVYVEYEELCQQPEREMQKLFKILVSKSIDVKDNNIDIPNYFSLKTSFSFSEKELGKMHKIYQKEGLFDLVQYKLNNLKTM